MGISELGPKDGTVEVKTYREGIAQKVGHDLVIEVREWSATVDFDDGGSLTAVTLDVDSSSLYVREGHNGLKPLSDKDRGEIKKNIDAKILHGRPITFRSTAVTGSTVAGDLTVNGSTRPASFTLDLTAGRACGTLPIVQTEFGVTPYKGLMGALKVRDEVEVVLDVALPG